MKRILIIQTAFLGDVILATPVVSELKRLFPEAQIDVLVKKGNESLLSGNPHITSIHTFNKKQGKWKEMRRLIGLFRKEEFDLIVNLHRFASSGLITVLSKAKKSIGFSKNPISRFYTQRFPHEIDIGKHEVERNLSLIAQFGASSLVRPELYPSEDDFKAVEELTQHEYVCIAPASVWFTKQVPAYKWTELVNAIDGHRIYLVGGPEDYELCEKILSKSQHERVSNLAGKLSLLQSAALFSKAKRVYVNDSGPLHIASAVNAPTSAFFCSTVTNFGFGPLADDKEVIEVNGLACRPCGLHGHTLCPKGHFDCANKLDMLTSTRPTP